MKNFLILILSLQFIIINTEIIFQANFDGDFTNEFLTSSVGTDDSGTIAFGNNRKGVLSESVIFNGIDQYLTFDRYQEIDPDINDFSISFWIKPTKTGEIQTILQHGGYGILAGYIIKMLEDNKINFYLKNDNDTLIIDLNSTNVLELNQWTLVHIVVNRQSGVEIFFNASTVGSIEKKFDITNLQNNLGMVIGCNQNTRSECFAGQIDDLIMYNSIKTQSEMIQEIDICDSTCKTCIGQLNTCNSCQINFILTVNNACIDNSNNQACSPQCATCSTHTDNCDTCKQNDFRKQSPPYCPCQDGYFENQLTFKCEECPPECQTCDENGDCILLSTECEKEQYYDEIEKECKQCLFYDDECVRECPESTKLDKSSFVCTETIWTQNRVITLAVMFLIFVVVIVIVYFCMQSRKNTKVEDLSKTNINQMINQSGQSPLKYTQKMGTSIHQFSPTKIQSNRSIESPMRMSQRDLTMNNVTRPSNAKISDDSENSIDMHQSKQVITLQQVKRDSRRRTQNLNRKKQFQ